MILKRLYSAGVLVYVAMLVLAIVWFRERIIILDTSFALFHIARKASFSLYASRCGAALSQVLPVLAVKAGQSLNIMALAYSVGFIAYYFTSYLLCGLFRRYDLGLLLLFFHLLFVTDTFFYIPSEFPQGVNFLVPCVAAWSRTQTSAKTMFLFFPLFFACAFFHPLVSVAILYTTAFYWLGKDDQYGIRKTGLMLAGYFTGVIVNNMFFRIEYDRHAASGIKNFVKLFPNYFTIYSNARFLHDCLTKYYWIPIAFVGICWYYEKTGDRKKLLFFAAAAIGYFFLVNVSYPSAATPPLYIENQYLPLGFILALPLVTDVLPSLGFRSALLVMLLVVTTAFVRFSLIRDKYTQRLALERRYIQQYDGQKVVVKDKPGDAATLQILWGTPYEFWLLSTMETGKTASIIIDEDPHARDWARTLNKSMVVNWNVFSYSQLPARYFHFADTVNGYRTLD